jgi:hypothetical protein
MGEQMKTKPKFRVGQVVVVDRGKPSECLVKIVGFSRINREWQKHSDLFSRHENRVYPLTARERGPRRPAARGK